MHTEGSTDRVTLAEAYLQEAVYRSRALQAATGSVPGGANAREGGESGQCGLGEKAAVALDLSERGEELHAQLFPFALESEQIAGLRAALAAWVVRQDALDRKRNHFLKDFRHDHGFDRGTYSDAEAADYRSGLDGINAQCDAERRAAAEGLLSL